ncbi:DUF2061 domain-containing protein [Shewanella psychrotolerans]|uniref:DUF2061 domain-containing protein n=1 Tax=Shewanella psychrotolerans TaxID=2864206 RepID=UPI001C65CAF4|nr:DUF2061 domain-containing protein [Shewanella psychrotolerans]QYK03406.1 DUF2061 domain-containing protein [Shewanella psychrotolerans]
MIKTLALARLHFSVAFSITYRLTASIIISGTLALVESAVNTLVFYCHDKAWNNDEHKKENRQAAAP